MTTIASPSATPKAVQPIAGLHHVTGITADVQRNIAFYTKTLGLRLVKVTINYDDPHSYHLYYGDGLGRPGTALTFFGWPGGRPAAAGTGQVSETAFAVPPGAAGWWQQYLTEHGVADVNAVTRFGTAGATFRDPDGLPLAVIEGVVNDVHLWAAGGVPAEAAIRGFYGVTLSEQTANLPAAVLVSRFGWKETAREGDRVRFEAPGAEVARSVDVVAQSGLGRALMGAGQMHHVAFRTPSDEQQAFWLAALNDHGHHTSPVMDRDYFHSIYFREPGGTLFEIATDGPGFTRNETPEALGTRLMLPAWLEPQRAELEKTLPVIEFPLPMATTDK